MFDEIDEIKWYEKIWWPIQNFIQNWIYPAYYLKNFLFYKHNKIVLPMFKSYQYVEITEKIKFANFELIKQFIEKEQPEKYVLWYKDENNQDVGPKYGECKQLSILFPDLKNKWIMDIIKEIYNFYTKELPQLEKEYHYLLTFNYEYVTHFSFKDNNDGTSSLIKNSTNLNLDDLKNLDIDWNIIEKYIKKDDLFKEDFLYNIIKELQKNTQKKINYYLHLCIEVRPYLWI